MIVACIWAYFQYFRGRTYRERMETEISGTIFQEEETEYLVIIIMVKNSGLFRIRIHQKETILKVLTGRSILPDSKIAQEIEWDLVAVLSILEDHAWLEPAESISNKLLGIHVRRDTL